MGSNPKNKNTGGNERVDVNSSRWHSIYISNIISAGI